MALPPTAAINKIADALVASTLPEFSANFLQAVEFVFGSCMKNLRASPKDVHHGRGHHAGMMLRYK